MKLLTICTVVVLAFTLDVIGNRSQAVAQYPSGEIHVVDKSPYNWAWITWNVFEHLVELDPDGKLVPGLATDWLWIDDRTLELNLREGVKFHNGEAFNADIVRLNWEDNTRLKQPHIPGTYLNFKPGTKLAILDPHPSFLAMIESRRWISTR